jgi:hypothetical protein
MDTYLFSEESSDVNGKAVDRFGYLPVLGSSCDGFTALFLVCMKHPFLPLLFHIDLVLLFVSLLLLEMPRRR